MVAYHDTEWGVPCHDDPELFERLALESFQAGLSWSTILHKRAAFRAAFRGFDPARRRGVRRRRSGAADGRRRASSATAPRSTPRSATRAPCWTTRRRSSGRSMPTWRDGPGAACPPARRRQRAATSRRRHRPPTRCRRTCGARGFRFVGSTIVYAFMQSVGPGRRPPTRLLPLSAADTLVSQRRRRLRGIGPRIGGTPT